MLVEIAGRLAETCNPWLARRIAEGDAPAASGLFGRLILKVQTRRAARTQNWTNLRERHAVYWRSANGDRFYDRYSERFERWFLTAHSPWVDALCASATSGPYRRLCEIGCGDGRVLQHLAGRLPGLDSLTGLDLNASIIERNRINYAGNPRLQFESTDGLEWMKTQAQFGSIVLTYGGVFEYLSEADLADLFAHLARHAHPSLLALVEPLAKDFDPQAEKNSRPFGREHSFSHPYRRMLETAGFAIEFDRETRMEWRWTMLVARTVSRSLS
jgi:SAM-dependent methyltransferase